MANEVSGYPTSGLERFVTGFQSGFTATASMAKQAYELKNMIESNKAMREGAAAAALQKQAGAINAAPDDSQPGFDVTSRTTTPTTGSGGGGGGGGKASGKLGEVIDYKPSDDTLKLLDINQNQYDLLRRHLIGVESSGNYGLPRSSTGSTATPYVMGGYQMSDESIKSAAAKLNIPVPSDKDFLSNPKLQEQILEQSLLERHAYLTAHSPQYASASSNDRAAMLTAAHYAGQGGLTQHLANPAAYDPADKKGGPKLSDRLAAAKTIFAGAPPPPTQTASAPTLSPPGTPPAAPAAPAAPRVTDPTDPGYSPPTPDPTDMAYAPAAPAAPVAAVSAGNTGRPLSPVDLSSPAIGPTQRSTRGAAAPAGTASTATQPVYNPATGKYEQRERPPAPGQQTALQPSYLPDPAQQAALLQRPQAPPPPSTLAQLVQLQQQQQPQYPQQAALVPARSGLFG